MAIDVPEPVAAYLAAEEAKDADALSRCFTEDGSVYDQGRDYLGRDSIRQWKQEVDTKYRYVLQPIDVQTHGDKVVPGSPVNFPGVPLNWTTSSNFPTASLLHWRFGHDSNISFPCFGR